MIFSDPQSALERWLYTNAPAAWISAVIAIISCLLVLRSRKKPSRLVFSELKNTSLVTIWPSVRDQIKISFAGKDVTALSQIDAEIFNEGSDVIQRPIFTVMLPQKTVVLGALVTPEDIKAEAKIEGNKVIIDFPYLNPVREHGQVVKLSILADGDTEQIVATGMGEGWSVRQQHLPTSKQRFFAGLVSAAIFLLFGIVLGHFYIRYVERNYGIPGSEMSWRAVVASLPLAILMLSGAGLIVFLGERVFLRAGRPYRRNFWRA
jgi:hypothetical protein